MHTHKGVLSTEHGTRTQGMHSSHSTKNHTSYIYVYTLILHRMVSCVLQSLGSPLFLNVTFMPCSFIVVPEESRSCRPRGIAAVSAAFIPLYAASVDCYELSLCIFFAVRGTAALFRSKSLPSIDPSLHPLPGFRTT